ncbi:DEAD/DEAH box helicase, partial [Enterococcus faecalis]|nr:DEAD/DEAH box helicase [Enterococcus faecalis]
MQKEICKINNISNVGDYSYASSQLENEGVDGNFSILLDMGVPASAIKKIVPMLSEELSLKEVVNISKKIANSSNSNLLQ